MLGLGRYVCVCTCMNMYEYVLCLYVCVCICMYMSRYGSEKPPWKHPPNFHYFEKNQLFDLRPDLARSWVLPGDWRPRNAILSTFLVYQIFTYLGKFDR